jgi:hypothetical protein
MRYLTFCFIAILLSSCSAEIDADKQDTPITKENIESEKRLNEATNVDQPLDLAQDNIETGKKKSIQKKSVYTLGEYFVISPNGLRMRDGPTLSDEVLATIPYLEAVEVLNIYDIKKDTLNKKALNDGKTIEEDFDISNFGYNVIGDWIQVQYKDRIGYAFSAYLARGNPRMGVLSTYSHAIQFVGRPPDGNRMHSKHILYWYNMVYKEDGIYLEPVSIHYRKDHHLNWRDRPDYVWTTPSIESGLILGSPKKMSSQKIVPVIQNIKLEFDSPLSMFPMSTKLKKKSEEALKKLKFSLRKIDKHDGVELIIAEGDQTQALKSEYRLKNLWPENITLVADIDQDGKLDYLIAYFGEKTLGVTFLFISTEAEPGQLVKDVAYYDKGWPD